VKFFYISNKQETVITGSQRDETNKYLYFQCCSYPHHFFEVLEIFLVLLFLHKKIIT